MRGIPSSFLSWAGLADPSSLDTPPNSAAVPLDQDVETSSTHHEDTVNLETSTITASEIATSNFSNSRCSTPTIAASETDAAILTPTTTTRSTTPTGESNDSTPSSYYYSDGVNSVRTTYSGGFNQGFQASQITSRGGGTINFGSGAESFTIPPGRYNMVNLDGTLMNFSTFDFDSGTRCSTSSSLASPSTASSNSFTNQSLSSVSLPDGAHIVNCQLSSCSGKRLTVTNSSLSSCNFSASTVTNCQSSSCNLRDCKLCNCYLSSSNVRGGSLTNCSHSGSNVR